MDIKTTALLLVGYQNDYFGENGFLNGLIEDYSSVDRFINNTVKLVQELPSSMLVIATPIHFTPNYEELIDPVGIIKAIKDKGALQANSHGAAMIDKLLPFKDKIAEVRGKRGFNAFTHTNLHQVLQDNQIKDVVIAGAVTSLCIDSTGRAAKELNYKVSILKDCSLARTDFEKGFYCEEIFPMYGEVITHQQMLDSLKAIR